MKTITCKQLGGACDQTFSTAAFEEMTGLSKEYGKKYSRKMIQHT